MNYIKIKDLFAVNIDKRKNINDIRIFSPNHTIVKLSKDRKSATDIFTKITYDIYEQCNYIKNEDFCCFNIIPLASVIKEVFPKAYVTILSRGKIDEIDLIHIYDHLNGKNTDEVDTNDNTQNNNLIVEKNNNKYNILTDKLFYTEPIIGRNKELKELMVTLATEKKNPILVGPSGCGKSVIVNELAYLIQNDNVPKFLKDKKIIKLNVSDFTSNTKYRGELEEKFNKIINDLKNNDSILFIDEIHTIVGAGATDDDKLNISEMLKPILDSEDIKIIGTTTDIEYNKYFETTALKRRFEVISINEPDEILLFSIIKKTCIDYFNNTNISALELESYLDDIIYELISLTNKKNRTYNDIECNPSLVLSIIDKSFAEAKLLDNDYLTIDNIIYGINSCNRLYNTSKETCINNLIKLTKTKPKTLEKVIKLQNHI